MKKRKTEIKSKSVETERHTSREINIKRYFEKEIERHREKCRKRNPESISYTSVIKLPIGGGMGHFETELSADTINGSPKLASGEK